MCGYLIAERFLVALWADSGRVGGDCVPAAVCLAGTGCLVADRRQRVQLVQPEDRRRLVSLPSVANLDIAKLRTVTALLWLFGLYMGI